LNEKQLSRLENMSPHGSDCAAQQPNWSTKDTSHITHRCLNLCHDTNMLYILFSKMTITVKKQNEYTLYCTFKQCKNKWIGY